VLNTLCSQVGEAFYLWTSFLWELLFLLRFLIGLLDSLAWIGMDLMGFLGMNFMTIMSEKSFAPSLVYNYPGFSMYCRRLFAISNF
jgi:hypothetical protein